MSDSMSNSEDLSNDEEMQGGAADSDQENADINRGDDTSDEDSDIEDSGDSEDSEDSDEHEAVPEHQFDDDFETPATIKADSDLTCVKFNPQADSLALGSVDGEVSLWKYSLEKNEQITKKKVHAKSVRGVEFSPDGKRLFTISKDKSWKMVDTETMQVVVDVKDAHKSSLFSQALIDEWLCATGDEDGAIHVWDHRTPKQEPVQTYKQSEDYIADLLIEPSQKKVLLAASAEGTLTAIDVRRKKVIMQSELFEEEFLSLALIKGKRVVCGGSEGSFEIFNWDEFGYIVNAMKSLSKASIDCMTTLTDNIVVYGSGDGNVRAASLFPNKPLGIIGKHSNFPVMSCDIDRERKFAASVSVDQTMCFWSVQGIEAKLDTAKGKDQDLKMAMNTKKNNFFSGLVDNAGGDEGES